MANKFQALDGDVIAKLGDVPGRYRSNYLGTSTSQGNYRVTRRWDCAWRPGAGGKGGPCS